MGWETSDRGSRLPKDWHKRRARCWRAAGGQCQATDNGTRCTWRGRLNGDRGQCDHIDRRAGDDQTNLQWLCPAHHDQKTRAESLAVRTIHKNRPTPPHPGLIA